MRKKLGLKNLQVSSFTTTSNPRSIKGGATVCASCDPNFCSDHNCTMDCPTDFYCISIAICCATYECSMMCRT